MIEPLTVNGAIAAALAAYTALSELGEDVEDEWTYVTELTATWQERLDAVATARAGAPLDAAAGAAIERLIDEVGAIDDPHRAIDWLSTFPQVVLLALGESS